jgi:hypothetical protein
LIAAAVAAAGALWGPAIFSFLARAVLFSVDNIAWSQFGYTGRWARDLGNALSTDALEGALKTWKTGAVYGLLAAAVIGLVIAALCDPNGLVGTGAGPDHRVLAGKPITYTAMFENIGAAAAGQVDVDVPIANELDPGSIAMNSMSIDGQAMNVDTQTGTVTVNGVATPVSLGWRYDETHHVLRMSMAGPPVMAGADPFRPDPHYGDLLGAHIGGEMQFTISTRTDLAVDTPIDEHATVIFDREESDHTSLDTPTFENKIGLLPGQALAPKVSTRGMAAGTIDVVWKPARSTPTRPYGAADSYVIAISQLSLLTRRCTIPLGQPIVVPAAQVTAINTKLSTVVTMPSGYTPKGFYCVTVTASNALGDAPVSKLSSKRYVT